MSLEDTSATSSADLETATSPSELKVTETEDQDFTPDDLEAAGALKPAPDPGYIWSEDPQVLKNLESWQDMRVGVIIHWGIYAAIGQGGSWSLHRGHLGDFTDPPEDWQGSDAQYQTWYYDQARSFTGKDFDAEKWAQACAGAGMKYVVFTTKHHDGFALYDTKYSNCKATAEDAGLGRDIFGEVCQAFRGNNLRVGAYFSKADWHHPAYWDRAKPIHDRFHNYPIESYPRRWNQFVEFTQAQIEEILSNYGEIDVLWLDAGWVRSPEEPIGMEQIAQRARELQPGILVVDREVHGPFEDYRTPEQNLAPKILDYPWEACITLTRTWCSLRPDEPAKPITEIIQTLLQIVSRGGNYLIGIGPDATGAMPPQVEQRLGELGQWLEANGRGIYGSRAYVPQGQEQLVASGKLATATQTDLDGPENNQADPGVTPASTQFLPDGSAGFSGQDGWQWYVTRKEEDLYLYGLPTTPAVTEAAQGRTTVVIPSYLRQDLGADWAPQTMEGEALVYDQATGRVEVPFRPEQVTASLYLPTLGQGAAQIPDMPPTK